MNSDNETKVSYELTFIKGDAAYFANLSEILFRPQSVFDQSINCLMSTFPDSALFQIKLSGSLREMIRNVQNVLKFPSDRSHSLDAFSEYLSNLDWLDSQHIITVLEMTDDANKLDQCLIMDAFSWAVTNLNLERRFRLSVLVILN